MFQQEQTEDLICQDAVVQKLQALDDEYLSLKRLHQAEKLRLIQQLEERRAPLLQRRLARLQKSDQEPEQLSSFHCAASTEPSSSSSKPQDAASSKASPALPGFWKIALQNSAEFQEDIEEYDEPVLDYLSDIRAESTDEGGFRLIFVFEQNPYFTNSSLAVTYHTQRKHEFDDKIMCTRIESDKILWSPGRDLTMEVVSRKGKAGRKKDKKAKRGEVSRPSFFRALFRNLGPDQEIPQEELEDDDQQPEDKKELMDCLLHEDFERALMLKDSIVPHGIRWYTGAACEDEDEHEDMEEEAVDDDEPSGTDVKPPEPLSPAPPESLECKNQ